METNSSSVVPVFVGGLVGHIFPSDDGRIVGGCVGVARLNGADWGHVGGCVGYVYEPGARRFVGGCAGAIPAGASNAQPAGRPANHSHRETRTVWRDEAIGQAAL